MGGLFQWLQGRTTAFLVFFSLSGTGLQIAHKLDGTYITLVGVILGYALGHSIKEDVAAAKGVTGDPPKADGVGQ
jgi:hypothetical protein